MTPDLDVLIASSAGDLVSDEIDAVHFVGVTGEILSDLERLDGIPEFQGGVLACGHEQSRIAGPGETVNGSDVASERSDELAGLRIPQFDAIVKGCRGDLVCVR